MQSLVLCVILLVCRKTPAQIFGKAFVDFHFLSQPGFFGADIGLANTHNRTYYTGGVSKTGKYKQIFLLPVELRELCEQFVKKTGIQ